MRSLGALGLLALSGCVSLDVTNTDAPDIERVLSSPAALEQTIAGGYQSCHNAIMFNSALGPLLNAAFEAGSTTIPPSSVNSRSGAFSSSVGSGEDFLRLSLGARLSVTSLDALDKLIASGGSLGTAAQNARARAFGFFAIGCHQAWLAMIYDSAAVVTPKLAADAIPPLSGAQDVMRAALALLDSAIAIATSSVATGTGGFPLPAAWMNASGQLSRDDFVRVVRSLRARFRAGVARTPEQRGAVNWPAVIADVDGGITSDFTITVSATAGWGTGFNNASPAMSNFYYGMADTSGGYDAWLSLPLNQRTPFLVFTPDRRWPGGTTRAAQLDSSVVPTSLASRPYVSIRTQTDASVFTYTHTSYTFNRLAFLRNAGNVGPFPEITRAEMNLLAAEGFLRAGNIAAAAARIDSTRVRRGQLAALSGSITSVGQPVPGGRACVPRVPRPALTGTQCGDIWEALKWEKRMETALTGFAQWFFDSRGWGDLVEGTALEFPVPSNELAARHLPDYSLGGGFPSSAKKGTYGF
jgi:hypothetical protein